MTTTSFDAKRTDEVRELAADFTPTLTTGDVILSASCLIYAVGDATKTDIPAMKLGAAWTEVAQVIQLVTGGTDGAAYKLRFSIATTYGQRSHQTVILPVSDNDARTASFDAKGPDEEEFFAADFAEDLKDGETITSGQCDVYLASDLTQTDIPTMKLSAVSIADTKVTQKVIGGTDGESYILEFTAFTSRNQRLVQPIVLPISEEQ
jgi:hypothetical protein